MPISEFPFERCLSFRILPRFFDAQERGLDYTIGVKLKVEFSIATLR
jgi:hypothetical protein